MRVAFREAMRIVMHLLIQHMFNLNIIQCTLFEICGAQD